MPALTLGAPSAPQDILTIVTYVAFAALLVAACMTDLRKRLIPNWIPIALAGIWLTWNGACALIAGTSVEWIAQNAQPDIVNPLDALASNLVPGLITALVFGGGLLIFSLAYEALTHKSAMGGGDIKLLAACSLYLGLEGTAVCLLVACILAIPLALLIPRTRFAQTDERTGLLPFAPAIALGALVALLLN